MKSCHFTDSVALLSFISRLLGARNPIIARVLRSDSVQFLKRISSVLLLLLVLAFGLLFAVQNTATAPLDLLFIQLAEQRIALWILLAFAGGGLLGMLLSAVVIMRLRAAALLARRQLKLRDKELAKLRNADRLVPNLAAEAQQSPVVTR